MAAKKQQQTNAFGSTKFAAISLSDEEKRQFKGWWTENENDMNEYINIALREQWKSSSSYDDTNDCFIVSFTMRDPDDKNYDICVTSRSDNLWEAYGLSVWKIYVLFKEQKLPTEARKNNWG